MFLPPISSTHCTCMCTKIWNRMIFLYKTELITVQEFISDFSPMHPEGLRDPPSLLLNGRQGAFLKVMWL
jgi:hypothetical protein